MWRSSCPAPSRATRSRRPRGTRGSSPRSFGASTPRWGSTPRRWTTSRTPTWISCATSPRRSPQASRSSPSCSSCVYGQALAQMADAEVRLFHLYVHEPLMRESVPVIQIAEEMADLAEEVLPLAAPVMDHVHQRFLAHFIEQDVVGHMEAEVDGAALDLGRLRVAIAFADLAGYTRLTEEEGEEEAVSAVGGLHRERRAHAPAPPDRDPLRRRHLPRWRLLRQRRQPGVARCGAIGGRRGHRHAAGRRGGGLAPEVHAWARCG